MAIWFFQTSLPHCVRPIVELVCVIPRAPPQIKSLITTPGWAERVCFKLQARTESVWQPWLMLCPNVPTDWLTAVCMCERKEQRERAIDGNGRQFALTARCRASRWKGCESFLCLQPANVWSSIRNRHMRPLKAADGFFLYWKWTVFLCSACVCLFAAWINI